MNKKIIIGIVVIILVAGGVYWFMQNKNGASNVATYGTTNSPSPSSTPTTTLPPTSTSTPVATSTKAPSSTPTLTPIPASVTHNVTIQNFAFNPAAITIKKGDTVVWTNKDPVAHTITGDKGGPASAPISTNKTYSFTFNSVGTFGYHCSIAPSMKGTVVVAQ